MRSTLEAAGSGRYGAPEAGPRGASRTARESECNGCGTSDDADDQGAIHHEAGRREGDRRAETRALGVCEGAISLHCPREVSQLVSV